MSDRLKQILSKCFIIANSTPSGEYFVRIDIPTLKEMQELHREIVSPYPVIEPALEIGLRMLEKGNVIFTGGSKHVVRTPRALLPAETFVCERPHQDEDFSYLCGYDYCRCCS
jgi:hypothetical protein